MLAADEAREIYEDYVRRTLDPALLEYIGRDTISARVFPIPAGKTRRIELTYTEILNRATVYYEEEDVLPHEDFILYYSVLPEEMGMTLLTLSLIHI